MNADSYPPIGDYGLLSDCHSAALVSTDGSIDWCCFHRFDARPVFGRILDRERGGYFQIRPTSRYRVKRRYIPQTNVLETTFTTRQGVLEVTDCIPVRDHRGPQPAPHPYHQLLRVVRCRRGSVSVLVEFHPRFDYGLTIPTLEIHDDDLAVVYGGADALVFQSEVPITKTEICGCTAKEDLQAGDERIVAVTFELPHELRPRRLAKRVVLSRVRKTIEFWDRWSSACTYDGPYRERVLRSALVLKALTHGPTGAIVAAPTTSLPEHIGGERNWDYRYSWLRDAAMSLRSLFVLGYSDEAHDFMSWLMRTTAGRARDLRILYGVGGERLIPEFELPELQGHGGSAPVRVGNAAAEQFQLDVYGYLLDTAWQYVANTGRLEPGWWPMLAACADEAASRWEDPDDGMWEVRDGPRHFVSSKVMAWVAVDRARRIAKRCELDGDVERWREVAETIRRTVDLRGTDDGSFVQQFGAKDADASALLFPLVRFLAADDPRVRATVDLIERELVEEGFVRRYRTPDGFRSPEGAFVICSFWLVDNLALLGDVDRAEEVFERICASANDLGLLAEQTDPRSGRHLGNFPQAFSHVGLIGAALNLQGGHRGAAHTHRARP